MTWKIEARPNWYCIYDEMGWYVAGCQSEQQAKLIANAPQMLEALEKISRLIRLSMSWGNLNEVKRQADAVIAVVKGKDSDGID